MRIAILGWGSLYWSPRSLSLDTAWKGDGPVLPIEFSRQSSDGRLTLVIDPEHGVLVHTYWTVSGFKTLSDAIENLRCREGCGVKTRDIGFCASDIGGDEVAMVQPRWRARVPSLVETVRRWVNESGCDAVIWTDLEPRWPYT